MSGLVGKLAGWLAGWLGGWAGWLVGWFVGRLVSSHTSPPKSEPRLRQETGDTARPGDPPSPPAGLAVGRHASARAAPVRPPNFGASRRRRIDPLSGQAPTETRGVPAA